MLYAASSRRSTVILQRQASSRESKRSAIRDGNSSRPSSSNTTTRPNTANGFIGRRPTTPYKKSNNSTERIRSIQDTFMLSDHDLEHFFRAFCYMAKAEVPGTSVREQHKKDKNSKSNTSNSELPISSRHSWEEKEASNIILSISSFFSTFQLARRSNGGFLDGIFDLVGTQDLHAMTFVEFLEGICTFGMFKLDDMVKLLFFFLDKEKEGRIPRLQLLRFVESLHGKKILVYEQVILPPDACNGPKGDVLRLPAAERQKASVDYAALKKLCIDYPTILEPMLLLQNKIRRRILGEVWWKRKENQIEKYFRTLGQRREKKRMREEKRLLKERRGKIIEDVGFLPYVASLLMRRGEMPEYPKPIVSLEEETGEVRVEWTRIDGKNNNDGDEV